MRMTGNRINNADRGAINKALDWTALGKLVRQRAAEALSATGHDQDQDSPATMNFGSGKDSA